MKSLLRTLLIAALPYLVKMLIERLTEAERVEGAKKSRSRRRFADKYSAIEAQQDDRLLPSELSMSRRNS